MGKNKRRSSKAVEKVEKIDENLKAESLAPEEGDVQIENNLAPKEEEIVQPIIEHKEEIPAIEEKMEVEPKIIEEKGENLISEVKQEPHIPGLPEKKQKEDVIVVPEVKVEKEELVEEKPIVFENKDMKLDDKSVAEHKVENGGKKQNKADDEILKNDQKLLTDQNLMRAESLGDHYRRDTIKNHDMVPLEISEPSVNTTQIEQVPHFEKRKGLCARCLIF